MNIRMTFGGAMLAITSTLALSAPAMAETFRLGHHHAVGGQVDIAANYFADLVEERSGGEIEIQVFPAAQLGQEREAVDLVNAGAIDISITSTPILDQYFPPMAATSAPGLFTDWEQARALYQGEFGTALAEGVAENSNIEVLSYIHLGFRDLMFVGDAPTELSGMEGKRMRSPENFVWIRMFELMGARPTPVTWGEVYTAMQTGVAEGFDTSAAAALDMNFDEVSDSLLKTQHMFGSMLFAMNEDAFTSLSEEDQALIKTAAIDTGDYVDLEVNIPAENEAYALLEAEGIEIVEPADPAEWQNAMAPLLDEIVSNNPGSQEFIDMIRAAE